MGRAARVLLVVGVALGGLGWVGCGGSDPPADFANTLTDMREEFGSGARVVTVEDIQPDIGIAWEVLSGEGEVTRRVYTYEGEQSRSANGSYSYKGNRIEEETTRSASADDEGRAELTLGDLDPATLDRICKETQIHERGAEYELDGKQWTWINSNFIGTRFAVTWKANADGTKVKQIKGPRDLNSYASC